MRHRFLKVGLKMDGIENITAALDSMQKATWYSGQITRIQEYPVRESVFADIPEMLAPEVRDYLEYIGISKLYSHQADACQQAVSGKNVILSTSTASGKTLAFLLPVLHELAINEDACALFLYPLKALTNDQLLTFNVAEQASGLQIDAAVYDGDTPRLKRPKIRQMSRVVLSNPFEIHETLPYHHMWRRFFANLKYIVIDEAHRYTGVFGSNVAQVLRRLARVARAYGADPQFILASASIANPGEHASALTGADFLVIDQDGSPAGEKTLVFFNGGAPGPDSDYSASANTMTRDIVGHLLRRGIKTLCFTRSRKTAELVAGLAGKSSGGLPVAPYRAGYLPEERRHLERDFKAGLIRGIVSTNALELGIDIGDLDAVVMSGYPGSISGFWQQVGRAGRRGAPSLSVFVAFEDILDQYVIAHPEVLLMRGWERATIDLKNEHILAGHMLCAASELPVRISPDVEPEAGIAAGLAKGGLLHETEHGYIYGGTVRPQEAVKLDKIGDRTVALFDLASGELLETIDFSRAMRDAFKGAVYLHQTKTWVVEELDLDGLRARLSRRDVDYYTVSHSDRQAEIMQQFRSGELGRSEDSRYSDVFTVGLGSLKISTHISSFLMKRFNRVIGGGPLDMPVQTLETTGFWIDFSPQAPPGVTDLLGAIHALEHTLVGIAPLALSCDPDDLAGFSITMAPHSGAPALFVYDGYQGGIGLCERAFGDLKQLMRTAASILSGCACESGCPACCLSARCGNNNLPMDKNGGAILAAMLAS